MTPEQIREEAVKACAWRYPFFLPALAAVNFVPSDSVPTMGVMVNGTIYYCDSWVSALPKEERVGVVLHELSHLLSLHAERKGNRSHTLWNVACDMAINNYLRTQNIPLPKNVIYPLPGLESLCAEDIYDKLKETAKEIQVDGSAGNGCGPEDPGGPVDGEKDNENRVKWRQAAAQAKALAAGTGTGGTFIDLVTVKASRQRWGALLRGVCSRAAAAHGKDEQTFTRRSRRSPEGMILPGWKATRARVAVVVDASGSVSDSELATAVAEIAAISKSCEVKIYLVIHDDGVQWQGWINGTSPEVKKKFRGRGGTSFEAAYQAVQGSRAKYDACVHLTDGEVGVWPNRPTNCRALVAAIYNDRHPSTPPNGTITVKISV